MKGFIFKLKDAVTGKLKLPVTVTDAVFENSKTQSSINENLRNNPINQQFSLFNQCNHRGGINYPENTMPAFEHSISVGFKFCECDVLVTKDGKFVALHDNTIDRTSTGTGDVSSYTYAQLQNYDFGSWKSSQFAGTKIPLIKDIAMLCKKNQVMLELDCAGRLTQTQMVSLYDELNQVGALKYIDICGYASELKWLYDNSRTNVAVSVSFLNQTPTSASIAALPKFIGEMSAANISINKTYLTPTIVSAIRARGWNVKTWTIASSLEMETYFNLGADTILINSDSLY